MEKPVNIEVFVPLHQCCCHYTFFAQKVFQIVEPHKHAVNVEIKGITSPDGVKYGIKGSATVVNKETLLLASFKEEELLDLLSPYF
jgi:hypothetical protein